MRLPNNYGCVTKLKGKRRKPWIVRKRINEYDANGRRKMKVIGYARTRSEALDMLAAYNGNPYDLDQGKLTFKEVYEKWYKESFDENTNRSTTKNYTAAYKHCTPLYGKRMIDIRAADLQEVIDACPTSRSTANRMKILFGQLYKWSLAHDIVSRNYSEGLKVKQSATGTQREAFTKNEIDMLWRDAKLNDYIPLALIMIYSGCRISELLNLKKEDVHLDDRWFEIKEAKTDAGLRRVPIAEKVAPFWTDFIKRSECENAICTVKGQQLTYDNFKRRYWQPLVERLGIDHVPHETRHTCISLLTMANVNPTYIKLIVGHKSIMDLTERVYTHIEISELIDAINKI